MLQDDDTVVIIKDLPVKGASKAIKTGSKGKNIKLTSGDHNIDCKVEGFGAMGLKSSLCGRYNLFDNRQLKIENGYGVTNMC